jgi:BirA family biotin operon repressor/biotin-[acetyl-CoA-carboxylase] ligase
MGVGINLKAPAATDNPVPPIGLLELDARWTPASVLQRLAQPLVETVLAFERQGFAPFQARFHARDVLRGQSVMLSDGQAGVAQGVSPTGELLLAQGDKLVKVHSAEVSVRPSALKAAG